MPGTVRKHNHPFYKTSVRGSRYSLIENDGVIFFNGVIAPEEAEDIRRAAESAIGRLDALLRRERLEGCVIAQTVFYRSAADREVLSKIMTEYYGDYLPVTTFVPQKPCDDTEPFLFEILAVKGETRRVRVIRRNEHAVLYDIGGVSYGFFGGFEPSTESEPAYVQSLNTFEQMKAEMERNGFQVSDLVRTWLYQGSIVRPEGETQRYKELNRARTDFFEETRFVQNFLPAGKKGIVYPASTGIGTDGLGIRMAGIAIQADGKDAPALTATPLENPGQTPAFDYGEVYSPQSPKFSRAMALSTEDCCHIFISGTASINDSETQFVGDPAGQTRRTIENILALISGSNLERHGLAGFSAGLDSLAVARVYVKRKADYPIIRIICDEAFRGTPVSYTIADVCRDDLLVEIEGIAVC